MKRIHVERCVTALPCQRTSFKCALTNDHNTATPYKAFRFLRYSHTAKHCSTLCQGFYIHCRRTGLQTLKCDWQKQLNIEGKVENVLIFEEP